MKRYLLALGLFAALGISPLTQSAHAWIGVRIGIGVPLYVGPGPYYYGYPYYPYYYPPAVVAAPPAVVYQTAPPATTVVVRSPGETVAAPAAAAPVVASAAAPAPQPVPAPPPPLPPVTNVIPVSNESTPPSGLMRQLSDANETVRRDAAVELGRQKSQAAVDALTHMLSKDSSPIAREGAARALGLIAAPRSLNALIFAAQADNDREVRHSAQFAVEVIRSNLRGN